MSVELREEDGILWVKLNRPHALNAINEEVVEGLWRVVDYVKKNKSVRVVIITGEGKAFCAGADIKMFSESDAYQARSCLLYTSPSPRDRTRSRMPSSA